MTTNSRAAQRVPSRTPPFVLVGLIVVLSFLGFSYYSLSSSNSSLTSELEAVRLEKRDVDSKHYDQEKTVSSLKSQVTSLQTEANQLRRDGQAKDMEIQTLKADLTQKVADDEKQRSLLERCDEKLSVVQKDLEAANSEKSNLQQTLDAEREKTAVCSMEACQGPIRQILVISSNLVGSTKMQEALSQAQLDGNQLMDGINIPAPVNETPQDKLQSDALSGKALETKRDDLVRPAVEVEVPAEGSPIRMEQSNDTEKSQVDQVKESDSKITSQRENENTRNDSPVVKAATAGVPETQFDQAEHQGVADGNRSFPNDGDTQVEDDDMAPEIEDEEGEGEGLDNRSNGIKIQKAQEEEQLGQPDQPDSLSTKDKANFVLGDEFDQVKPNDQNIFDQLKPKDGNTFDQIRPNEGNAFNWQKPNGSKDLSLSLGKVSDERDQRQEVLKEAEEPKAMTYRTFQEKRQVWDDQRQAGFENGENVVQHFETVDKRDFERK